MGTRGTIAIEKTDGTIKQMYCQFDSYLEHLGLLLYNDYKDTSDFELLDKFMDLKCIESLRDSQSVSYAGRFIDGKYNFDNLQEYLENNDLLQDYNYIYRVKTKKWYLAKYIPKSDNYKLKNLKTLLIKKGILK